LRYNRFIAIFAIMYMVLLKQSSYIAVMHVFTRTLGITLMLESLLYIEYKNILRLYFEQLILIIYTGKELYKITTILSEYKI